MTTAQVIGALIFCWLLGMLWGEVWRVVTRYWSSWMS